MSKRSSFERVHKDFYPTIDPKSIPSSLLPHIQGKSYAEPCYGEGDLEDRLMDIATCNFRSDIRETVGCSKVKDVMDLTGEDIVDCDLIITNPPFDRKVLLPMLDHMVNLKPTWLLLPADIMHNKYFTPYMKRCSKVVSVGRLYWFKDNDSGKSVRGTDNYAWFFWPKSADNESTTVFETKE